MAYFTDSPAFGGAERALLQLLAGLDRDRWRPVLFHHPEPGLARLLQAAADLDVPLRPVAQMPMGLAGARHIGAFMSAVQAERPGIFHAHLTWPLACKHALTGAVLARLPVVVATVQLFMDIRYSPAARLQQFLLAARVDRYIAVSRALARRLERVFGMPARKVQVIHNAVPAAEFARAPNEDLRRSLAGGSRRPVVLTAARLENQKGLGYWLQAARLVPDAVFVLAGDGPARGELSAQARQLEIDNRVKFLGHRVDVAELLSACDVFVLPSLYEGSPLAILEAMAAGKPVVATAIAGIDEIVAPDRTGCLVPPADPAALAAAIRSLLHDPTRARQLGQAAQAHVRANFDTQNMVRRVTGTYAELLRRRRGEHASV